MSNPVATVTFVQGQVWAKSPDGSLRALNPGSLVTAEETIVTAEGASIELDFGDGIPVAIAGGQEIGMGRDLWDELAADANEAALDDESVQQALAILEQGGDLFEELEDTAAGLQGGSGGGGISFVRLSRLVIDEPETQRLDFADGTPAPVSPIDQDGQAMNYPPVAADLTITGDEDTAITGQISASDPDGDLLTYLITTQPLNGSLILDASTGQFTYVPNADYNGDDSFVVTITDARGNSTISTVKVNVTPVNDLPVTADIALTTAEDQQVSGQVVATDVDGDALTYSLDTAPTNGIITLNPATGEFTYIPNPDYYGSDSFVVMVSDGNGGTTTSTITVDVTPVNDAPVVTPITLTDINEDGSLTLTQNDLLAGASDVDGDSLTAQNVTLTSGNGSLVDNGDGTWTFTPTADWSGAVSFDFDVTDGTTSVPNTASLNVLPVNDAPVVAPVTLTDINEDGSVTLTQSDLLAGASDVDGDSLTAQNVTLASGSGSLVDNGDGTWTFTPTADWNGAVSFDFEVTDGTASVPNTAGLNVLPVNDAPVVAPITLTDINEDGSLTLTQSDLLAGASDVDGDSLLAQNVTLASGSGSLVDNGDGTWTFTPTADWNGVVSFDFEVSDGTVSVPNIAGLNVLPINDAPVVAPITLADINEDGSLTLTQSDLLAGATDVDGDSLIVQNVTLTTGNGSLVDNGDGTWTFTPTADWNGAVSFSFDVFDGTVTVPNTAGLNVLPVNDAPVVAPIMLTDINEDGSVTLTQSDLLAGASDVDGDSLTAQNVTLTTGNGSLVDNGDGTWTFTPTADWNGAVSFSFDVFDGTVSVPNTAGLNVLPVNDAPVVAPVTLTDINEDGSLTLTQSDLLAGASDVDGDSLLAQNVTLASGSGSLVDNGDGTWTFTPTADWNGAVSFDFEVFDGTVTVPNSASLNVLPVNDAPTVAPITLVDINEDGSLTLTQSDLLAGSSDMDGDSLIAQNVTLTTGNGSLVDNGDGTWTFTPTADWNGAVSFDFDVFDGTVTVPNTAGLNVLPVNDAPVVTPITLADINEDGSVTLTQSDLLAGASDVDGDSLTAQNVTLTTGSGSLVDNGDGTWTFTPTADWNGAVSFSFDIFDGTVTVPNTAGLSVLPVNDAPVVAPITLADINEDGSLTLTQSDLLAGASDVDGDSLIAQNVTLTTGNGSLVDNGDGTWTFTPTADWNGAVSFDFEVFDGTTAVSNTAGLNVLPVNDAPIVAPITLTDINEDGSVTLTQSDLLAGASDVDGDSLTAQNVTLTTGNGSLVDNGDGTWTFTPTADWNGAVSFSFDVFDGTVSVPNTAGLNVLPVNDAPVVAPVTLTDINEDGSLTLTQSDLLAGASDVDGDSLLAQNVTLASGSGSLVDNGDGTWTFTPTADWNGVVSFDFEVSDGTVSVPNIAGLNVLPINDAPVVAPITLADINEDGSLTLTQSDLLAGASDVDGDSLIAQNVTLTTGNGSLVDNGDGTWTFTPTADWNGAVSFDFEVTDGTTSVPNSAGLNVLPVNDAPTVAPITLANINEDGSLTLTQSDLLAGASDVDGDSLIAQNVTLTTGNGSLVDNGDGTWTFTPTADWNGAVSFDFEVSDGTTAVPNTAGLNVLPVNDAPIAVDDTMIFTSGLRGEYWAYEEGVDGDNLTIIFQSLAFIAANPASATFVATTINYGSVANGLGGDNGLQQFLGGDAATLSSDPVNTTDGIMRLTGLIDMEAGTYRFRIAADDGFSVRINGVVVAEYHLNHWAEPREVSAITGLPFEYTVTTSGLQDIEIIYWDTGENASLRVEMRDINNPTYEVLGGDRLFSPAIPIATNEDQQLVISVDALLANDSDPEGDTLTIESVQDAVNGNVSLVGNNVVFTPIANYNGLASFTYTISDGNGGSSTATVTINVLSVNDAPVAETVTVTTDEDTVLNAAVTATDIDGSVAANGYALVDDVTAGNLTFNADGSYSFNPGSDFDDLQVGESRDVTFTYTASDTEGAVSAPATITITVNGVNDAPVAVNNYVTVAPVSAPGLFSKFYNYNEGVDGPNLTSIALVESFMAGRAPNATFINTSLFYGEGNNDLGAGDNLQNWIGADVDSLVYLDRQSTTDAIMHTQGKVYLEAGTYNFRVRADDGYSIRIDGVSVAEVNNIQSPTGTVHLPFTINQHGYYDLDIIYWDQAGQFVFDVEISNDGGLTYAPFGGAVLSHEPAAQQHTFDATDLLKNATDADGDALSLISVQGAVGGTVAFDSATGVITFVPQAGFAGNHSFDYTLADSSGVQASATTFISIVQHQMVGSAASETLPGTGANDQLTALDGDDTLIGGQGNDLLLGGLGADTFVWNLGDQGVAGAPAVDTVSDFNLAQGDVLNLADLLQGEESNPLTDYLHFESNGTDTTVHISSAGNYVAGYDASLTDQVIVLEGVNLSGSNAEIITQLQNLNNLQVD